jgi:exodeoxyribonuclease-3
MTLRILSWNVNGLRACDRKGFRRWLDRSAAFVACIQEVRARHEDLPRRLLAPRGWSTALTVAERRGYSGVGTFARRPADATDAALAAVDFDREARLQLSRFGLLTVANVYFPQGNGRNYDNSRVPYKLAFYRAVKERVERERRAGQRVVVLGDFNTAHREIDLARPRENRRTSGFLPEERAELDRWLADGWIDSFRCFEPAGGHYTWWKLYPADLRARNVGWRIDLALLCPEARRFLCGAFIQRKIRGSDHCPIGVDLDPRSTGD